MDKTVLESSANALKSVRDEFDHCDKNRETLEGSLGSGDIADAMKEFTGNWDRHRKQLSEQMGKAESAMRSAAATFTKQDGLIASGMDRSKTTNFDLTTSAKTVQAQP